MRPSLAYLLPPAIIPLVFADVEFLSPAAGNFVAVGTIDVSWQDSGRAPSIDELTIYTLSLMVGGDGEDEMVEITPFVSGGDFSAGDSASGTIPAGIAQELKNGL